MRTPIIALLSVIPALTLGAQSGALSPAVRRGLETITAADVTRRIGIIADDSMLGRDTPSPGLEATARYISCVFLSFGLDARGESGTCTQRQPTPGRSP